MIIHIVRRGDTLFAIARKYGVSVSRIMSDNGITDARNLAVGQALIILLPTETHTVLRGETVKSVAAAHGITEYELLQNNPTLIFAPSLQAGQQLSVRFSGKKADASIFNGYAYPGIRRNVLLRALPFLTYLTIFGYGFTENGGLIGVSDEGLISLAYSYGTAPVMLLASLTENGGFSSERVSRLINDASLREKVVANAVDVMLKKGYVGLDCDFEYIPASDAEAYADFLSYTAEKLHEYGLFLSTDLAPKSSANQTGLLYEAHDYPTLGRIADSVLLMTYEWGYTYGPPMAVAPLPQVKSVVSYAVTEISPQKILLGVPNYGYDWTLPYQKGVSKAATVGNQYAVELASRRGAEILYDETVQSPHFYYRDGGKAHEVWFEDVHSIERKLLLRESAGLRGVGLWTVMYPFAQCYALISARYTVKKFV